MVITFQTTIAATNVAQQLVVPAAGTTTGKRCSWATVQREAASVGVVSILAPNNNSAVGYQINSPGDSVVLWSPASLHASIDLSEVWIKGTINDKVNVIAVV